VKLSLRGGITSSYPLPLQRCSLLWSPLKVTGFGQGIQISFWCPPVVSGSHQITWFPKSKPSQTRKMGNFCFSCSPNLSLSSHYFPAGPLSQNWLGICGQLTQNISISKTYMYILSIYRKTINNTIYNKLEEKKKLVEALLARRRMIYTYILFLKLFFLTRRWLMKQPGLWYASCPIPLMFLPHLPNSFWVTRGIFP
jgi:hypothetical protein